VQSKNLYPDSIPIPGACEVLPDSLRAARRWLVWRDLDGRKVPYSTITGRAIDASDPAGWSSFEEAVARLEMGGFDGLGFALGDGWAGADFDGVLDLATGAVEAWAEEDLVMLGSYCEVSPSRTGFKVFLRLNGEPPFPGEWKNCNFPDRPHHGIGLYCGGFFTVTGCAIGDRLQIEERSTAFRALYALRIPTIPIARSD
jgi:putative DNA primase/helicase